MEPTRCRIPFARLAVTGPPRVGIEGRTPPPTKGRPALIPRRTQCALDRLVRCMGTTRAAAPNCSDKAVFSWRSRLIDAA